MLMRLQNFEYTSTINFRLMRLREVEFWVCRDQYAGEAEEPQRRKSLQIMPMDSSPTASPPHSASAADLEDSKELKRNGMRITFKVPAPLVVASSMFTLLMCICIYLCAVALRSQRP